LFYFFFSFPLSYPKVGIFWQADDFFYVFEDLLSKDDIQT
jgi:hypothetical protein